MSAHRHHRHHRAEPWHLGFVRLFGGSWGERARLGLFVALLALVALCGGSSRADAGQLLVLRPLAVLLATAAVVIPGPPLARAARGPGLLLAAFALAIAVQLVPLPPGIWTALPGHAPFAEAARAAGVAQPWRPITLSVDLTLNSLVALTIPAAVLLAGAALRPDQRAAAAGLVLLLAVGSALLGLVQVSSGGALYFYSPTSVGRPVGLFANINHQAALLAAAVPLAAAWGIARRHAPVRGLVAGAAGVLLVATVLVSGSRSGLLLAGLAVLSVPLVIGDRLRLPPRARPLVAIGAAAVLVVLVAAIWAAGRLGGLDRLMGSGADQRVAYLPITLAMLRGYFPVGSGFGTFDAAFRHAEPDAVLKLTFFNHAHNDLLELGITGGLLAVAVLIAFLVWAGRRAARLWTAERTAPTATLGRAGLFAAAVLLAASLADYPLRTPLAAAILALASLWMADRPDAADRPGSAE